MRPEAEDFELGQLTLPEMQHLATRRFWQCAYGEHILVSTYSETVTHV